ncbi:MAG: DHA2 family efflux MFS transporter permease subunit [Terracidiphilus sp.]
MASHPSNPEWKPRFNPWLVAVTVAIAAFMEVLDTSIANVALPHIAGNLGATQNQATWVLTTYLVSNAIVLPMVGWVSSAMGRKRFFMLCIVLFAASSLLCGLAPTMPILLLARALQGIGGGGMQPMSQAIMADSFPPRQRAAAFALFGVTVLVAPALGPILGGWITDNFSWRWIFLINLPVGLFALGSIFKLVEDPPFLRRFKPGEMRLDTLGLSLLVLGVGALQILLDKGQEDDWFGSNFIVALVVVSIVCLSALVVWEWRHKDPLVEVKFFTNLNFSGVSLMMFLAGAVAFSSTVLMPQFLQTLAGYSAQQAGLVVSAGAAAMFLVMPLAAALTTRVPVKYLIAFGWLLSAFGLYLSTRLLNLGISFPFAAIIMVMQYVPIPFIFVPAMTASYFGVPQNKSDSISGLTNFMRNIGSSFGTSIVTTVLARRQQFHTARLTEPLSQGSTALGNVFQTLAVHTGGARLAGGQTMGLALVYQYLMGQAAALSFIDTYVVLGAASTAMFLVSFLLKSNDPRHTEVHAPH